MEAALLVPAVFAIFFGAFEFTQVFFSWQRASSLSREVALAAFRDCAMAANVNNAANPTVLACLEDVRSQMTAIAQKYFKDFSSRGDIIVSLYGTDSGSNTFMQLAMAGGAGGFETRYNVENVPQTMKNVAIAELYYDIPLLTPIEQLMNVTVGEIQHIYQATII
ncbi:MAG: pilus assembly protein [Candidatus Omnitrophica bacterium]|nr:pilus assembly protein [Candidatus Omnitrophota bacterium]